MQGPPLNTSAPIGRASDPRSHVIEAAEEPHEESWANINAMNGLVHEVLDTDSHVVVSAMAGNAGAGGVPLALAADEVCARPGVVLNPHHKGMELFGSEYWTYLFPRECRAEDRGADRDLPADQRPASEGHRAHRPRRRP